MGLNARMKATDIIEIGCTIKLCTEGPERSEIHAKARLTTSVRTKDEF